jgi:hypothetical protein
MIEQGLKYLLSFEKVLAAARDPGCLGLGCEIGHDCCHWRDIRSCRGNGCVGPRIPWQGQGGIGPDCETDIPTHVQTIAVLQCRIVLDPGRRVRRRHFNIAKGVLQLVHGQAVGILLYDAVA